MPLEWNKLRTWNGSQNTAFEELICQLASQEPHPAGSIFIRKGVPDAGVECFWTFPSGEECAWQAKFFIAPPSTTQWTQVDESVKTALDKHSALHRYTICMAVDRSDARIENGKSFLDRWNERVEIWRGWAEAKSMNIEFPYWGTHEIFEKLSQDKHRGRNYFWFHKESFSQVWFKNQLNEVIAAVGPRYTPALNVLLPISEEFDGLSRSPDLFTRYRKMYGDIGKILTNNSFSELKREMPDKIGDFYRQIKELIELAKGYDKPDIEPIEWTAIESKINELFALTKEIKRTIDDLEHTKKEQTPEEASGTRIHSSSRDPFGYSQYVLHRIEEKLYILKSFARSDTAIIVNTPMLLLVGSAGTGKTHLFSDAASRQIASDSPSILLLGNQFRNEEPWGQILKILGLTCSREEFLGALESAAQLAGRRAVIFIDALNEGEGRGAWATHLPSMIECISRYPWIALAVSVRDSYEKLVIPEWLVPDKLTRFEHAGFTYREYDATKTFFEYYGIEFPTVPVLSPEFQNPLFLSCFCRGLKNSNLTRIPAGMHGISVIFNFFLDSVNEKLSKPECLDYDIHSKLVKKAAGQIASSFSRVAEFAIPRAEAQTICGSLLPERSFEKSLFRHMISEGILSETLWYDENEEHIEMITFSYERLRDHMIMQNHLEHINRENPIESFRNSQVKELFKNEARCWQNQGLLEALAIQCPEVLGKEIFELLPEIIDMHPICEAFIGSLLWRNPKTISEECLPYVYEHILKHDDLNDRFWNLILTIAPNPEHPFNADFLHANLMRFEMAERDAWWSIFLYNEFQTKGVVDRLVDWAWSDSNKEHISDDSIRLVGKALIWFLTTSHRFLRDRATKALVSLFDTRIKVLCQVIPDFQKVNDIYVLERIYAVAYGCALRSNNQNAKHDLAQLVYNLVFKDGSPPCHILLRDYARGIVEVALRDGLSIENLEVSKIRPPYISDWPLHIPSIEEVKHYGELREGMPEEQYALTYLYSSVMGSEDFARYILGTDRHKLNWSNRLLKEPRLPSRRERYKAFETSLTQSQKKALNSFLSLKQLFVFYQRLTTEFRNEKGIKLSVDSMKEAITNAQTTLCRALGRKKTVTFNELILPYINDSSQEKDELAMPVNIAQRWIIMRVIDLGWSIERFGKFDRNHDSNCTYGRSPHKPERIGKKYQWIAYHEFLAHLADNLIFRKELWSDEESLYDGPWQLWLRDIDPSCLLKNTFDNELDTHSHAWWTPVVFDNWTTELDEIQWLKRIDLLPKIAELPIVTDPNTGRKWYVLECLYNWEEPTPPENDTYSIPHRFIWYILKSYLVKTSDEIIFYNWAKGQDFIGRWMPEVSEHTSAFLGEYFWAPAFFYYNTPYYGRNDWTRGDQSSLPCSVLVTADSYMQAQARYDCSIDNTVSMYLPAKWIAENMGLSWGGIDSCYFDFAGNLVAQDPSDKEIGPRALLIDKELMEKFLNKNGYRIVWSLYGEKDIHAGNNSDKVRPGKMELSGVMKVKEGELDGIATAYWLTKGDERTAISKISISTDIS